MFEDEQRLVRLKPNLRRRALILKLTRDFFLEQDFLEVETPVRVPAVAPEPQIQPFDSEGWFLSTSPELYMKRMLAAGYDRLFQLGRCFRRGERGRWHNPEFTMLEWYRAGADYLQMVRDIEQLVITLADKLGFQNRVNYGGQEIDLSLPWPGISVREAFVNGAGWDPVNEFDSLRFDTDLVTKVIPGFNPGCPTVLKDYPAPVASLARLKPEKPGIAERAEVFIGGLELANVYSELTDAPEQAKRFQEAIKQIRQETGQERAMPRRFLEAVAHLPCSGGGALGMDRLVMLFCDAASIDEVVAFTVDTA